VDHDVSARGDMFGLRPVTIEDAEFIVELRTDPKLSKFIHATSSSIEEQRKWLAEYLQRDNEWYFIVETFDKTPEGTICIYNFDQSKNQAEWGRWVLRNGSLSVLESAVLIYDTAFNQLRINRLYCHTESQNLPVISFHTTMGLQENGTVRGPQGEIWTEQFMMAEDWPVLRAKVAPLIARLATRA
jgi:RimJ/RimL family protein N-acetyltransferase